MSNNQQQLISKAQQVKEIVRCGKDPVHFIRNWVYIQHPKQGTIKFTTHPYQDECIRAFQEHRLNIVLKARQLGLTTLSAAYALWLAIFHKDKAILVIATKLAVAINFIKKVRFAMQHLPSWLMLPKPDPTNQKIQFSNGSSITAIPTSQDAGRGEALSLLIVDECAWVEQFADIWTGLAPTFSVGGNAILMSTPNGVGGQYYRLWIDAEAGVNDFNPIRLPWQVHPEHDQAWYEKETKSMSVRKRSQEFDCDFITSGDTFLQPDDLEYLRARIVPPKERTGFDRNIWVWQDPFPGKRYVISADVSRGDARDFSAFHIIENESCEVVAEYMGKIPPEKLADVLGEWGKKYNNALLAPENNTFGYFVNTKLRDVIGYRKLYYDGHDDWQTYMPFDSSELPGFSTNAKTRVQILTKLEELIRNKSIKVYSQRFYDQLQGFVWNGNRPQASKDSYDDLIMSLAIGCWLVSGANGLSQSAIDMSYAILSASCVSRRTIDSMPGNINEAKPLVSPNLLGMNAHSMYRPRDLSGVPSSSPITRSVSDFRWLLR